ncbi:hypothetical protein, partial [Klebsiella pneumoniae]|uniref:hypothetical protein n=1 Tax=Klebsiella pneumoniae TaxID=573 RepID=UPI00272FB651
LNVGVLVELREQVRALSFQGVARMSFFGRDGGSGGHEQSVNETATGMSRSLQELSRCGARSAGRYRR